MAILIKDNAIDPKIAASHPSISNPGKKAAQIFKTAPFTTNVNSPKVKIFIGNVKNIKTGQMVMLARPMRAAANSAAKKPLTLKPLITFDVIKTATAESVQ